MSSRRPIGGSSIDPGSTTTAASQSSEATARDEAPLAGDPQLRDVGRADRLLIAAPSLLASSWMIVMSRFTIDGQVRFTLFDDAMISMSYGRTLADGHGWVWFPGAERVEGFTNPLWTLMMAALHLLPIDERLLPLVVMVVGAGVVAWCGVLAAQVATAFTDSRHVVILSGIAVSGSFPLLYWSVMGMEVGLFVALALLLTREAIRVAANQAGPTRLCLVAVLGLLCRFDFVIPIAAAVIWLLLARADRRQLAARLALASAACIALQTGARLAYYGAALPNTYYLKAIGAPIDARLVRGGTAALDAMLQPWLVPLGLIVLGGLWQRTKPTLGRFSDPFWLLAGIAVAVTLYSVAVGGDAWDYFPWTSRYLTAAGAFVTVLAIPSADRWLRRDGSIDARRAAVLLLWVLVLLTHQYAAAVALALPLDRISRVVDLGAARSWGALLVGVTGSVAVLRWPHRSGPTSLAASPGRAHAALACVVAALVLLGGGTSLRGEWMHTNDTIHFNGNVLTAEYGAILAEVTTPDAMIAVVWAGNPVYWSHRPALDLLGRTDATIARGERRRGDIYAPGHDKWDYDYSIRTYAPDVVAQLFHTTPADESLLVELGYQRARPIGPASVGVDLERIPEYDLWVRLESTRIDWSSVELLRPPPPPSPPPPG